MLTFEDQLLDKAQKEIEATEKLCKMNNKSSSSGSGDKQNKSSSSSLFKKAFGISSSSSSNGIHASAAAASAATTNQSDTLEHKFVKAIALADCKLYLALLTFIRQDTSGYIGNGFLRIRRAWKMYAKLQRQLYDIYKRLEPNAEQLYGSETAQFVQLNFDSSSSTQSQSEADTQNSSNQEQAGDEGGGDDADEDDDTDVVIDNNNSTSNNNSNNKSSDGVELSLDVCKRLLGAVSFGYGLFQICFSFIPANVLRLVKLLGFESGDRSVALRAINFTSQSGDMRAPFADMTLLWYATIATPLFGVTEPDILIKEEDTRAILDKAMAKYPRSSLFLFYKGKYERSVRRDTDAAMLCYSSASLYAKHIREIQFISIYEAGWLNIQYSIFVFVFLFYFCLTAKRRKINHQYACKTLLIRCLRYADAIVQFEVLAKESRWSRSFSAYICAILMGCVGRLADANAMAKEGLRIVKAQTKKSNPVEVFALKRNEYFKRSPIKSKLVCELLVAELLYLWVCVPFCEEAHLRSLLQSKFTKMYIP